MPQFDKGHRKQAKNGIIFLTNIPPVYGLNPANSSWQGFFVFDARRLKKPASSDLLLLTGFEKFIGKLTARNILYCKPYLFSLSLSVFVVPTLLFL